MYKLLSALVIISTASAFPQGSIAAGLPFAAAAPGPGSALVLVAGMGGATGGGMTGGGMGGMTGGGMGGMTGGGMGGMTGGPPAGVTGGATTGMPSRGFGGTAGYGDAPASAGDPYGRSEPTGGGPQSPQYYHCVTKRGQCSVSSSLGALRNGASCSCLFGGKGKIK